MVRDNQRVKNVIGPSGARYPVTPDVERFLRSMDRGMPRSLMLEMAAYTPEATLDSHVPPVEHQTGSRDARIHVSPSA